MASGDCNVFWSWLSRVTGSPPARDVRTRRRGAAPDGDGVDGPVDSATMTACLRFVPPDSGVGADVMDGKLGSGGGIRATAVSPLLGNSVADKGAAGGTRDSFGFAFVSEKRREREGRWTSDGGCSGRYVDGGEGGVDAGRASAEVDVSSEGVRGVMGADDT